MQARARPRLRSPLAVNPRAFGAYIDAGGVDALRRYRTGLGDSTVTATGQIVSKGASIAAGAGATALIGAAVTAVGGAAAGAALGSVVPVVGTVIGAAIGYLTSKLFGHADYAAVYANIANVMSLYEAYEGVAGQYPGRIYGWPEMQYVYHGAMVYGLWPGNGPAQVGVCTQAMISNKINACGTGQWVDDLIGAGAPNPGSGSNNIVNLVGSALAAGLRDPRQIVSQYVIPGLTTVSQGKNNGWISPAKSSNPQVYQQMLIDLADIIVTTKYPQTPVYYGTVPAGYMGSVSTAPATTTAPVAGANNNPVAPSQSASAAAAQAAVSPQYSATGATIQPGGGNQLVTAQGSWTFGSKSGNDYVILLNGKTAAGGVGIALSINSAGELQSLTSTNASYVWTGSGWTQISAGTGAAASQTTTPMSAAGTTITPTSGGSIVAPSGTWTFGTANDGNGNYNVLLNGSYAAAGNSNATQLQVNSAGVVIATVSNGATYSWSSTGWTTVSAPTGVTAVSAPVTISANGATIIPGSTASLVTSQGEWEFSTQTDGTGNYYVTLNGSLAGAEAGIQLSIMSSVPTLLRTDGSTWAWTGTAWNQQTAATSATATSAAAAPSLYPAAPVDTSDYDAGASGAYTGGGYAGDYDTGATAAPVAATTTTSPDEKYLMWGGIALAVVTLGYLAARHR